MHIDRNATPVVQYCDAVIQMQGDLDILAEAGQRLINAVVDHLVDEVM